MSKPRVFLTGGTGFVGRSLLRVLSDSAASVTVLTRNPAGVIGGANVRAVEGDLTKPMGSWTKELEAVDVVVNLAAELKNVDRMDAVNTGGVQSLLDVCTRGGIRKFVQVSSVGSIGAMKPGQIDEAERRSPRNPYEQSKFRAELLVEQWRAGSGERCATVLQPTTVYGPEASSPFVPFLIRLSLLPVQVRFGPATAIANLLYVDDLVSAIAIAIDEDHSGRYIVADPISTQDFHLMVRSSVGSGSRQLVIPASVALAASRLVDSVSSALLSGSAGMTDRVKALSSMTAYSGDLWRAESGWSATFGHEYGVREMVRTRTDGVQGWH